MEFESIYEISRTVDFIRSGNFTKVALQFPDELLKDSVRVVKSLKDKLRWLSESETERNNDFKDVSMFVMADTAYGSCCVDEVGASHIGADCVVHYGHACLSPTTKLPAFFVFGKAPMSVSDCVKNLTDQATTNNKRVLVLFGLEYAHLIQNIKEEVMEACESRSQLEIQFADIMCSEILPSDNLNLCNHGVLPTEELTDNKSFGVVASNRYDATENCMVTDLSQQKRILKRRYYLVEKAKDANIVGILVGTLGVAGYLHMINQMKDLIAAAGKKAYTLVMGKPNPAKLANFPECDVFIYVSCAQTALLDSKEYLAPVITPFEAMLAFNRGQWTGEYVMQFQDLINSSHTESQNHSKEARFSFLRGGYVEDFDSQENNDEDEGLALAHLTEQALQLRDNPNSLAKRTAKSGAEFLASRSYQGLEIHNENALPEPYVVGRSGRAAGYQGENS